MSADFVLPLHLITPTQAKALLMVGNYGKDPSIMERDKRVADGIFHWEYNDHPEDPTYTLLMKKIIHDDWDVHEKEGAIDGCTFTDNGCLKEFMDEIGINPTIVQ